jgi:phosphate-selective porin OprO/OprP
VNDSRGIGFFEHPDPTEDNFGTDPENRLFFRRLRLTFQGEIRDNMVYKMDLEFGDPEEMAFRDAFLGFENLPGNHRLIFGNQKRPFSLDDWNSSNDNVFMERPLVCQAFSDETRRVGVQIHGYTDDESLNWQAGVFQLENIATTGNHIDDTFQGSINGRISGTPFYDECSGGRNYLHLGVAGMLAWPNGFADDADGTPNQARFSSRPELRSVSRWIDTGRIVGADWFYLQAFEAALNLGPFSLVGEYMTNWVGRSSRPGFVNPGTTLNFNGFYVYAAYFLTGEAQQWDRKTGMLRDLVPFENFFLVERLCGRSGGGWGAWQVAVRYSYLNLSSDDVLGGRQSNVTFNLNWWWNANARLMIEYIIGEIDNHQPVGGFTEGNFHGLATRLHIDW